MIWENLVDCLLARNVHTYFGLPSDEPGLLDAAENHPEATAVTTRDQRVAAFAAIGYAQVTQLPSVVCLNSGPSFTNSLTGLLEASSLGVPIVVVTTEPDPRLKDRGGFQIAPQRELSAPLVSWYHDLTSIADLQWAVDRAVHGSLHSKLGITVISVGFNVLSESASHVKAPSNVALRDFRPRPAQDCVAEAAHLLVEAERPLILAGAGAKSAGIEVERCAVAVGAPVVTTGAGRGVIDESHPFSLGCAGLYAGPLVARIAAAADVILVVGSALEETIRIGWPSLLETPIIQIDHDLDAFFSVAEPVVGIHSDSALALQSLAGLIQPEDNSMPWSYEFVDVPTREDSLVRPLLKDLWDSVRETAVLVQENGLHDMWTYDSSVISVRSGACVVTPGEQTAMGFGIPAAVGATIGAPDQYPFIVCGDAAAEASVLAWPSLFAQASQFTVVVLDNNGWGWPRALRDAADAHLTKFPVTLPLGVMAQELGAVVCTVNDRDDISIALRTQADAREASIPCFIIVTVDDLDISPALSRELS